MVTPLLDFVRDMDRLGVPPFRHSSCTRLSDLACDLRQAALAEDAGAVAERIRATRLEWLWRVEDWLALNHQRHPRIAAWLHRQLVAIGWRMRPAPRKEFQRLSTDAQRGWSRDTDEVLRCSALMQNRRPNGR